MRRWSAATLAAALVIGCGELPRGSTSDAPYDLVILGGRVVDPASGLDAVRNVAVRGGSIAAIGEEPMEGRRVIDAQGLVVAPGFIDLHAHGQDEGAYALMVRDGVTSGFELEVGTADVDGWYASRAGGQLVHHGVSVGHIPVRMDVLGDPGTGLVPAGIGGHGAAAEAQLADIERGLREGLAEGAVAVGFGSAYTPGASMAELERMFGVAARAGATAHIHMRSGVAGMDSTLAAARAAGAPLHIVHVNSTADRDLPAFLAGIEAARRAGQDVTTEAYPYGAGMTEIQSALFDGWETWPDERFGQHQWVATGERLDRETFGRYRGQGGMVIIHGRSEEQTRAAVLSPLTMIASDGYLDGDRAHPRTSGTYSRVLGRYVREEQALGLMDALRKMTIEPARRLEARVPAMRKKGRLAVGADADLALFDAATVIDRATYEDGTIPAAGIRYVVVGGVLVVDGGEIVEGARPGQAIRAPVAAEP